LASIWTIIDLPGLLSHNPDIVTFIDGIQSSLDKPKMRVLSRYLRIKPLAFEYNRIKSFGTTKLEFVYFFKYPIIGLAISAGRHSTGIVGPSMWPSLLVACCVKAIPIHIIKWYMT
jgi:hypothetical protein